MSVRTVKLTFDFERCELDVLNSPWRVGPSEKGKRRVVTPAEFHEHLQRLIRERRSVPSR